MNNKKVIIAISIVSIIVLLFTFFNWNIGTKEVNVSLKWVHQAQFAGLYTAQEKGYYKREGLNVNFKEFDFKTTPVEDLESGAADFALMSAEEFLTHIDHGEDFYAVAAFYQLSPYALVTLNDSGIKSPADFIGKTLGIKGGKIEEELIYSMLLGKYGIANDKVNIKTLSFEKKELVDLETGSADVVNLYRTDQLYFFDQADVQYKIFYPEQFGVNLNNDILVTKKSFVEERPKIVEAFIEASVKGWGFALANRDEAVKMTLKYVTSDDYKDHVYEKYILDNSASLIQPSLSSRIGLINQNKMAQLSKVMKEGGFIKNDFDVSEFFTNTYIPR